MGTDRMKKAMEWFCSAVFQDEPLPSRKPAQSRSIPSPIRAARALENNIGYAWQGRESIFVKQARLLVNYEDDYPYERPVTYYYPTYQSLTDLELRAYFAWRTALRRGELRKTSLTYAFLYIYELLNQVGVTDPLDGYWKLKGFQAAYSQLDSRINWYLDKWLVDYIVYYSLDPTLLADSPQLLADQRIAVLSCIHDYSDEQVLEAVKELAPKWLGRSKFYREHAGDMDPVICRVLRQMSLHYTTHCKKTMAEYFFGSRTELPCRLFESAVFYDQSRNRSCEYQVSGARVYRCRNGLWSVTSYRGGTGSRLETLMKTVDSVMRECFADPHPIQRELDTKWLLKLIREETEALLAKKKATQTPKLSIDFSQLARIRADAAITRDKLIVDEELMEEESPEPPAPEAEAPDTPLSPEEYRLVQCLLYGRGLDWIQSSGLMLSVLVDSINEKLYDTFSDSVLDDTPELVEDYIEDLKEMVQP